MSDLAVIIPAYNYADRLPAAISSVRALPFPVELIVVDDGSTDSTEEVIQRLQGSGDAFSYIRQENSGPAVARNRGIDTTESPYLMFLDADDELIQDGVIQALSFLKENPKCDVLVTNHESVDAKKTKQVDFGELADCPETNFKNYLLKKKLRMSSGAMIIRRQALGGIRFPEALRNSEDIPFFSLMIARLKLSGLAVSTVRVNKHGDSLRHDSHYAQQVGVKVVGAIFDSLLLAENFQKYREPFEIQRRLSLFRSMYVSGDYRVAVSFYEEAIKSNILFAFKWTYLRKYIKACVKVYVFKN